MKTLFTIGVLTTGLLALSACGSLNDTDNVWNERTPVETTAVSSSPTTSASYTPGVFNGVGTGGFNGDIAVAVTVGTNGAITGVEITDHSETPNFANPAFDALIPAVVAAQGANVDIFAGATMTSHAFIAAVEDALSGAGGTVTDAVAGATPTTAELSPGVYEGVGTGGFNGDIAVAVTVGSNGAITGVEVTNHSETPRFADPAFEVLIPAVVAAQSAHVDIFAGATVTSHAFIAAVEDALNGNGGAVMDAVAGATLTAAGFSPGVYEGVGEPGYNAEITVQVTIDDNGLIADIEVVSHQETPRFADPAFDELIPAVIAAQSADIDIFAGATFTSEAFLMAVEQALEGASR